MRLTLPLIHSERRARLKEAATTTALLGASADFRLNPLLSLSSLNLGKSPIAGRPEHPKRCRMNLTPLSSQVVTIGNRNQGAFVA